MSITPQLDALLKQPDTSAQIADTSPEPMVSDSPDEQVNVINPSGKLVSVPQSQVDGLSLFEKGYSPATPEDIHHAVLQRDYGDTFHQVNAAIRGFGNIAGFGAFPLVERGAGKLLGALGVEGQEYNPEEVAKTEEANPGTSMAGNAAGLLTPIGELRSAGHVIERAAEKLIAPLVEKAAPYVPNLISKVGSSAIKAAVENAMVTGVDETAKLIASDPNQSVDTALSHLGFSSLFGAGVGGGFGLASPLWSAVSGGKVSDMLSHLKDRVNGLEGKLPDPIIEAAEKAGITVPPEIKSGVAGGANAKKMFQALAQSDTGSGEALQKSITQLRSDIPHSIANALGKTPEQIDALENLSAYDAGKKVQDSFVKEFKSYADGSSKAFQDIKEKFAGAPLSKDINRQLQDQIAMFAEEQGFAKNPSGPQNRFIQNVLEEIPLQKTAKDLRNYISNIGKQTFGYDNPLSFAGSEIKKILSLGEEEAVARKFSVSYPERIGELARAKASYGMVKDDIASISDRLHPGAAGGPGSFARAVADMDKPEVILNRLANLKDVNLQKLLAEKFPETAAIIKDHQLSQLLKNATKRTAPGEILNAGSFFKSLDALSPEMRSALISSEAAQKLEGAKDLLESLNAVPRNTSNTAPIAELINKYKDSTAMTLISMLTGHGPFTSIVVGALTKFLGRDVPDAVRLGLLKFLGSSEKIDSPAFKTMVDFIHGTSRGEKTISNSVKSLFKAGREVAPKAFQNEKQRDQFDKKLMKLQENPDQLFDVGGSLGHYMPEHQTALAQTAASVSQYLNSLRPVAIKDRPLDAEAKPSADKVQDFNNAMDIAQQPLVLLQKAKDGTISSRDLQHLDAMYPSLHRSLVEKINHELINHTSDENTIPYKTRMGLSLFIGEPLDSTMTPQAIQMNQAALHVNVAPSQQGAPAQHNTSKLSKMASSEMTPGQAREAHRLKT